MNINLYTRENPFFASIKKRYSLCTPPSEKETYHLILDIANSGIRYSVGDSVAIAPQNEAFLVQKTLQAMRATGNEWVIDRKTQQKVTLQELLTRFVSITEVNRKLVKTLLERQTHPEKRQLLEQLHLPEEREAFKVYLESREVWDILQEHHEVTFVATEWSELLLPLLPRFYSIASSQLAHPDEIHLTVALLQYSTREEHRRGVCSHYLWNLPEHSEAIVPIYIQPHKGFTIPENGQIPIIMIGPGTGVAPFRAFMQERLAHGHRGNNWLFFGECHRQHHYFYQSEWEQWQKQGVLELELAFSRDQPHKVYVQHLLEVQKDRIYAWLQEGAILYVCGDAHRMARDVEACLLKIISEHQEDPKQFLKDLRHSGRYLRDVY